RRAWCPGPCSGSTAASSPQARAAGSVSGSRSRDPWGRSSAGCSAPRCRRSSGRCSATSPRRRRPRSALAAELRANVLEELTAARLAGERLEREELSVGEELALRGFEL